MGLKHAHSTHLECGSSASAFFSDASDSNAKRKSRYSWYLRHPFVGARFIAPWLPAASLLLRRIAIAQTRRHPVRTLTRVVFELIAKMLRIIWIFFASGIRVRQSRMSRKRLDAESIRSVEIEILLEAVRIEKVIAHPPGGKRRQAGADRSRA